MGICSCRPKSQLRFELVSGKALKVLEIGLLHHLGRSDADFFAVRPVFGKDLLNQTFLVGH